MTKPEPEPAKKKQRPLDPMLRLTRQLDNILSSVADEDMRQWALNWLNIKYGSKKEAAK